MNLDYHFNQPGVHFESEWVDKLHGDGKKHKYELTGCPVQNGLERLSGVYGLVLLATATYVIPHFITGWLTISPQENRVLSIRFFVSTKYLLWRKCVQWGVEYIDNIEHHWK